MNKVLISVIVPVYNTAKWLRKCLDSIRTQTYSHLEIICVNDGSTDNSSEILNEYSELDNRIVVINQKNSGVSAARNAALHIARGQYVTGVDSDDFLPPNTYEKLVPWLLKGIDMVCYGIDGVTEKGTSVVNEYFHLPAVGEHVTNSTLISKTNAFICNKLFRTEIIKQNNIIFPVGKRYEDAVFFYTAAALSKSISYVPDAKYCYLIREDSFTNGKQAKNRAFDFCEILEITYNEFQRLKLFEEWNDLYKKIFLIYYEQTVPVLPSSMQHKAKQMYKNMVLRLGLDKLYQKKYPFHELSKYSRFRSFFYWRNEKKRVLKLGKWVILQLEETTNGIKTHWF